MKTFIALTHHSLDDCVRWGVVADPMDCGGRVGMWHERNVIMCESHFNRDHRQPDDFPVSRCPACGEPIDYCQGHGESGDPAGYDVLRWHDNGNHNACHPDAVQECAS